MFDSGEMDEEFEIKLVKKIEDKQEKKIIKKAKIEAINSKNKNLSQEFYEKSRQTSRQERYNLKNMEYDYKYYIEKSNTLPKVYQKKLRNMTNNNCYLWRRIYFYGQKSVEDGDNTRTIYELFRDKTIIHYKNNEGEWEKTTKYKDKSNKSNNMNYSKKHNFSFKKT